MDRFTDRVAIVTGASRGIGYGIAERLVAEGARVCITARKAESLAEAAATLGDSDRVLFIAGRSDDVEHQREVVAAAVSTWGRLDVLVNNTGVNTAYGPLLEVADDAARKMTDVNMLAALSWVREAHRAWFGEHGGAVVNVASLAGQLPAAGIGYYGASKAGLILLTQQLALELAPAIRVNAVAPAVIKTRFAAALYEGREAEVAADYPLARLGRPQDVAATVAFLASDDASWITGQTITIDGGLTLDGGI